MPRTWLALVVLAGGVLGPLLLMIGLSTTPASSAALLLKDENGKSRIVLKVAADGTPSLEFMDADGRVVSELPQKH